MLVFKTEKDFYTSVIKSLEELDPRWESYKKGIIIVGSHEPEDIDRKLEIIQHAREDKRPLLGICMGMQLMCIEYARNVLNYQNANSTEIDANTLYPIITKLPELRVGIRLVENRFESHWHNYAFNNLYKSYFEKEWNLIFTENILEKIILKDHPFFVGVQYHPEYQNSEKKPHPLLREFINKCRN